MLAALDRLLAQVVSIAWGLPLVVLLIGGGLCLSVYARFLPLFRGRHALQILLARGFLEATPPPEE